MKPAKMGFLLGIFIFCSVTVPVLSGVARLTHNICREYKESCNMDVDPGSCYEVHFRFFYNRTAGECQSFVFTGCNGNLNNYRLKIECDIECNEEYRTVRYTKPPPPTTIPPTKATTAQKSENLRIQKRKPFRLTRRRKYRKSQEYKRHHRSRGWWQARSQRKAATKNIRA